MPAYQITAAALPATLARLAELVGDGQLARAKAQARRLLDTADPHSLDVLNRCAEALQADSIAAAAMLDELWLASSGTDADIIEACRPAQDHQPPPPVADAAPARRRQDRWIPPRHLRVRQMTPTEEIRPSATGDGAAVDGHLAEHGGQADQPPRERTPIGYELDYDRAALPALRGAPCLGCFTERSSRDLRPGGWDDRLCTECRDAGRPGVPEPAGASHVDALCWFIADTYGAGALPALRQEYRRADPATRPLITAWVRAHRP